MKLLTLKIFLIFIYLISSSTSYAIQQPKFKNLIIHKDPIKHKEIAFNNLYNETINLDNYKNFLVIINFWATWCAPCISELPSLSKLQEKLDNTKFKLLLISIDRSGEKVFKPFLKKIGLTSLKSGNDPKTLLMQKLGLTGIPTTLLVSPTGEVVGKLVGTAKWDTRSAIDLVNFYLQK